MERVLLECAIRAALIATGTAIVLWALQIRSARNRHNAWTAVVLLMLLLPAWTALGLNVPLRVLESGPSLPLVAVMAPNNVLPEEFTEVGSETGLRDRETVKPPQTLDWKRLLGVVYLVGACILLLRLALGSVQAHRLLRTAVIQDGRPTSGWCSGPITVGWFHPRVILPQHWQQWSRPQLDAVLAHEGEHARRHDPLIQWLALLNRAVFWFHPLSWWLERKLSALAEEACDAAALAVGHSPRDYCGYLMDLARSMMQEGRRIRVIGSAMPGGFLTQRIRKILAGIPVERISRPRIVLTVSLCTICSLVFGAATLAPRQLQPVGPEMPVAAIAVTSPATQRVLPLIARGQTNSTASVKPVETIKAPPATRLEFSVLSIKPIAPGSRLPSYFACRGADGNRQAFQGGPYQFSAPRGRCVGSTVSLPLLIGFAYDVRQVIGGPDWVRGQETSLVFGDGIETFQIEAVADDSATVTLEQLTQMLQTMLEDRFHLKVHREIREESGYALVVAKGGPKLKEGSNDQQTPWPVPNDRGQLTIKGTAKLNGLAQTLTSLAMLFSPDQVPVADKTGLTGIYDFEFVFPNQPAQPTGRGSYQHSVSDISSALEDQLGLRIQREKVPVDVIVIDEVDRPTPN